MTNKIKGYTIVMLVLYAVALLACFICDSAINGTLTWFYIVIVSVVLLFSITNLPFIVKKGKITIPAVMVTGLSYLLLFVCCMQVEGDWLFSFAYPIATCSFVTAWILLYVFKSRKLNWGFKTSIALFISGVFTLICNFLVLALSNKEFQLIDLFHHTGGTKNYSANGIIFACLIAGSIMSAGMGLILRMKKSSND